MSKLTPKIKRMRKIDIAPEFVNTSMNVIGKLPKMKKIANLVNISSIMISDGLGFLFVK